MDKDSFVAACKVKVQKLDVPELGGDGHVWISSLTIRDQEWLQEMPSLSDSDRMVYAVAMSLCDEDGNRWFDDPAEGAQALSNAPVNVMQRAADAVYALNDLGGEQAGNLQGDPAD